MTGISVVNSEPLLRESGDAGSARWSAGRGRRICRRVRRAAARPARRDDRQPGELHALHADAPGGGVGHARAAPRRRTAPPDVPTCGAAARPRGGDRRTGAPRDDRARRWQHRRAPLRAARRRARCGRAVAARSRARRACARLQGPRGRDPSPQSRPARTGGRGRRARRHAGRGAPLIRLRRCRLRGRRGARRALRPRRGRTPLVSAPAHRPAAVGARRRGRQDPAGDPDPPRRVRRPRACAAWRRDPDLDDLGVARRRRGDALGRRPHPHAHARLDGRGPCPPAAERAGPPAGRPGPRPRRPLPPGRGPRAGVGTRRLRSRPERRHARARRPADLPARTPAGPPAGEEPERDAAALRLPDARAGGDARALQGDRGRPRTPLSRLSGLVRHAQLPPLPAAAVLTQASVVVDWTTSLFFRRDIAELSLLGHPRRLGE